MTLGLGIRIALAEGGGGISPNISLSSATVAEDASVGDLIGTLSVVNGSGTYAFTLLDDGGGLAALDGVDDTRLEVADALDFETTPSFQVTVQADNGVDDPISRVFTITVTNVFEVTLVDLSLDTDEIQTGAPEDTLVGTLQDVASGSSLSLTDDAGGRFKLDGTDIVAGPTATDFDVATSHNITVRETHADASNSPHDTVIAITVLDDLPGSSGEWATNFWWR